MSHRRRGVGVGRSGAKFQKKADEMKAISYQSAIETIEKLETKLTEYATKHQKEIQQDPAIRTKFLQMCGPLGIDPLASTMATQHASSSTNRTNMWSRLLFGTTSTASSHNNTTTSMSDFYFALAVKVAEVCLASRSRNGGIMSLTEIQTRLETKRTRFYLGSGAATTNTATTKNTYSQAEIQMAISKLSVLGGGFRTIEIGGNNNTNDTALDTFTDTNTNKDGITSKKNKKNKTEDATKTIMVVSVPIELNNDHMELLTLAKTIYIQGITLEQAMEATNWTKERTQHSISLLLSKGMAWVDHYQGMDYYWFPSIWQENVQEEDDDNDEGGL